MSDTVTPDELERRLKGGNPPRCHVRRRRDRGLGAVWQIGREALISLCEGFSFKDAKEACASLPGEAKELFGSAVKMTSCDLAELQSIKYIAYEYEVPKLATSVVQSEIPFTAGLTIIVVGGSNRAGPDHVRKAHGQITQSIVNYASAAQARKAKAAGRVPGKDELAALVKNNLLRYLRSVNANDFAEFHGHVSLLWKNEAAVEYFNQVFKAFMDNDINLLPVIEKLAPVFDETPVLSKEGVLSLKGRYPARPSRLLFEPSFIDEGAGWKLVSANVNSGVSAFPVACCGVSERIRSYLHLENRDSP